MIKKIFILLILTSSVAFTPADNSTVQPTENSNKEVHNIILMIGDGMGFAQMYAAYTVNGGMLNMVKCPYTGISKTNSADNYITDSAAGGTAMSTGQKTKNGSLAVDTTGKSIPTILEIAEGNGLSTGLVVTCALTHATPSAFIAHNYDRYNYEDIALDFLKINVDVLIGGGRKYFVKRKDGNDLTTVFKNNGYQVLNSFDAINKVDTGKLLGFTSEGDNPKYREGVLDILPAVTETAINILKNNKKGFFLMVEGSQIDWGGHANNINYITNEAISFDRAVGKALEFAAKDGHTLVIITADHETGGLALTDGSLKDKNIKAGFKTRNHSASPVPVFAFGPGAEMFTGFYENTTIFYNMMKAYGFNQQSTK
jgi:alkaline phosphatase